MFNKGHSYILWFCSLIVPPAWLPGNPDEEGNLALKPSSLVSTWQRNSQNLIIKQTHRYMVNFSFIHFAILLLLGKWRFPVQQHTTVLKGISTSCFMHCPGQQGLRVQARGWGVWNQNIYHGHLSVKNGDPVGHSGMTLPPRILTPSFNYAAV